MRWVPLRALWRALDGEYGPGAQLIAFLLVLLAVVFAVVAVGAYTGVTLAGNERAARVQTAAINEDTLDDADSDDDTVDDDTDPAVQDDRSKEAAAEAYVPGKEAALPSGIPTVSPSETIPTGWYTDPTNPLKQRLWDGAEWTDRQRPRPPYA
jgi:hypothetical protein